MRFHFITDPVQLRSVINYDSGPVTAISYGSYGSGAVILDKSSQNTDLEHLNGCPCRRRCMTAWCAASAGLVWMEEGLVWPEDGLVWQDAAHVVGSTAGMPQPGL